MKVSQQEPRELNFFFLVVHFGPINVTTYEGYHAQYICLTSPKPFLNVQWVLNGTLFTGDLPDISEEKISLAMVLDFYNVSVKYNQTMIECLATTSVGVLRSETSLLLVQGI